MVARFAVMGNPIAHSLSPWIHQQFAQQLGIDLVYERLLVYPADFAVAVTDFFKASGQGLNITLPHKQAAYELATAHTLRCAEAKSANTLWVKEGVLHADNTDGVGLIRDLSRYVALSGLRVLMLGAGGAARGIIGSLLAASVGSLTVLNRTAARLELLQQDFPVVRCVSTSSVIENEPFDLIINATALGMGSSVWDWKLALNYEKACCYDLSYSEDGLTPFVEWVRHKGCMMAVDGFGMLLEQAAESFFIWHHVMPDTPSIRRMITSTRRK